MLAINIFCIFALLVTFGYSQITASRKLTSVIHTVSGPIQGEILQTVETRMEYAAFKGIPYAEPPIGYRRFKPPVVKKPWSNTLRTTVEGSVCPQSDFVYTHFTGFEDCLYLNVYTPKVTFGTGDRGDSKPVIVWIHGGGYFSGYGNSSFYGPDFIVQEGIVLVTFNYRLGPLGFLNLNHANATGNAGLKDQNLVLKWVKANILRFGGNPQSVTILGYSAGATSVDFHVLSKMSRGLFHRSIAMSGSSMCPWSLHKTQHAIDTAFKLGSRLGINTSNRNVLLEALYKVPAIDMMKKAIELGMFISAFKPSIEDPTIVRGEEKFFTKCFIQQYEDQDFNAGPHLMGFMEQEALLIASHPAVVMIGANETISTLKTLPIPSQVSEKIYDALSKTVSDVNSADARRIINVITDVMFASGVDAKHKYLSRHSSKPVYIYRTSFAPAFANHKVFQKINITGPAHNDDLSYLFYVSLANPPLDATNPVTIVRKRIVRMWTNFAKYGNPTPNGRSDSVLNVSWPPSGRSGVHLEIGDNLSVINKHPLDVKFGDHTRIKLELSALKMC